MKVELNTSKNSFGWNPALHYKMTKAALAQVPALTPFEKPILDGAVFPVSRFDVFHLFSSRHCYYGAPRKPLSSSGCNAMDTYINNLQDSVVDWEFDEQNVAMRKLGEALHILQDMADPLHTQKGGNKFLNFIQCKKYDKSTTTVDIEKIMQGKPNAATTENFYDLFGEVYESSKNAINPLNKKYSSMLDSLAKKYILNACSASVAFLRRLGNLHVMTDAHRLQAIETEISSSQFLSKL